MISGREATRRWLLVGGALACASACGPAANDEFADLGRGISDVVLTNSEGEDVRWSELARAPRVVFFGFTHCPVICPVTIYELTASAERIGAAANDLRIEFITVDPDRDTPERMREYFSGFGPNVTGFTGAPDALIRMRAAFDITATRVPGEHGAYSMDHTATVFLLDRVGRVRDVIMYGAEQDVIDARLSALLS
jgi:protein SCO1